MTGDQVGDCCSNLGEKQCCMEQAVKKGGDKKCLALDPVFRRQKDVLVN